MTHADCRHFLPEPVGRAGLGQCAINKDLGSMWMPYYHKGAWKWCLQARLVWPGGEACKDIEVK